MSDHPTPPEGPVDCAVDRRLTTAIRDARTSTPGIDRNAFLATAQTRRNRIRRRRHVRTATTSIVAAALVIAAMGFIESRSHHETATVSIVMPKEPPSGASSDCNLVVRYAGATYLGAPTPADLTVMGPIGRGSIPPCDDTGGTSSNPPSVRTEAHRVQGLDPRDGIAVPRAGSPGVYDLVGRTTDGGWTFTPGFDAFLAEQSAESTTTTGH